MGLESQNNNYFKINLPLVNNKNTHGWTPPSSHGFKQYPPTSPPFLASPTSMPDPGKEKKIRYIII